MLSFVSSINLGKIINILLEPSVTLTLGIFTLLISRNSNLSTVARERLDKVYHPLFLEIEPFLYKKVSLDDISPFLSKYYELLTDILAAAEADKKRTDDVTKFIVPERVGHCRVEPVPANEVAGWLKAGGLR